LEIVAADQHGESDGSAPAFDVTRPAGAWTRQQRAALAGQLRPAMRTAEIARRLGVAPSTVRDYLSDPDGQQARARRQTRAGGGVQPVRAQDRRASRPARVLALSAVRGRHAR